jgi:site-specific DNA recombinase
MKQLKFFLYLRKSTDREDMQVLSIDGQRQTCERFAAENGCIIVDTIIEHESAKQPGRPLFNKMLERISDGEANAILAYHPNRLARNSKDGGEIIYWLDIEKIIDLKFPTFWFENTPQGKFMLGMEFVNSKRYSDELAVVTDRGLMQKCESGFAPINAPRGYVNDRRNKRIVIDPQTAPAIRQVFELYATGKETMESVAAYLTTCRIVSKPTRKTAGGKTLHCDSIARILKNPFYYGAFRFSGKLYEGKHEPLISKGLFDRVQEILNVRTHLQPNTRVCRIFTKLIRCGTCGMMITVEAQRGHVYYRCSRKSDEIFCAEPFLREEQLDQQLSALLSHYGLSEAVADAVLGLIDEESRNLRKATQNDLADARNDLIKTRERINLLLESYLEQSVDRPTYLVQQQRLYSEQASIKEKIINLERADRNWLERFRKWANTAKNIGKIAQNGSLIEKRALAFEIFGSNLRLSGKKLSGEAVEPWSSVAKTGSLSGMVPVFDAARRCFLDLGGGLSAGLVVSR